MIANLLVAYDGSSQAQKAFAFGLEMAQKHDARLAVVSVARLPEPPVAVEMQAVLDNATVYYQSHFAEMKAKAAAKGVKVDFEVRVGHPAEQIARLAEERKMDAIVMGHRGESLLQKWLVGSVAKRVLSYAPCTVIVVRG
ncbi:MAG: universal stress protein [Desulfobacteraceae bacterium]|nr:universal stress protein [Desulfobacteraceae bacterium]